MWIEETGGIQMKPLEITSLEGTPCCEAQPYFIEEELNLNIIHWLVYVVGVMTQLALA